LFGTAREYIKDSKISAAIRGDLQDSARQYLAAYSFPSIVGNCVLHNPKAINIWL